MAPAALLLVPDEHASCVYAAASAGAVVDQGKSCSMSRNVHFRVFGVYNLIQFETIWST